VEFVTWSVLCVSFCERLLVLSNSLVYRISGEVDACEHLYSHLVQPAELRDLCQQDRSTATPAVGPRGFHYSRTVAKTHAPVFWLDETPEEGTNPPKKGYHTPEEGTNSPKEGEKTPEEDQHQEVLQCVSDLIERRNKDQANRKSRQADMEIKAQEDKSACSRESPYESSYFSSGRDTPPHPLDRMGMEEKRHFSYHKSLHFEGAPDTWTVFLQMYNLFAKNIGWLMMRRGSTSVFCLCGQASRLYATLLRKNPRINFDTIVEKFENRYEYAEDNSVYLSQLINAKQLPEESLEQYADRVEALAVKVNVFAQQMVVQQFSPDAKDKDTALCASNSRPRTTEEALRLLKFYAFEGTPRKKVRQVRRSHTDE